MEHVVFFPAPDGTPAFRRVASLEDAVRLVEHLRNVEGVHEVSVHALGAEVPLAFRAWYRVEVPGVPAQPAGEPARVQEPVPDISFDVPPVDPRYEPVDPDDVSPNGHTEAKGLGFFA